jgi:hypothetical protein
LWSSWSLPSELLGWQWWTTGAQLKFLSNSSSIRVVLELVYPDWLFSWERIAFSGVYLFISTFLSINLIY